MVTVSQPLLKLRYVAIAVALGFRDARGIKKRRRKDGPMDRWKERGEITGASANNFMVAVAKACARPPNRFYRLIAFSV